MGGLSARRRLQVLLQIGSNRFLSLLTLLFLCLLFFNYYLSCRQTRNGHAERRSTDVVHADLMAKLHAVRIAAMFAADADLEFGARLAPLFDAPAHQHADTLGIERLEWIRAEYSGFLLVHVIGQEAAGVVAGKTHGGLREVVGSEREEFRHFRDFSRQQGSARQLDHGSDKIVELDSGLLD